MSNDLPQQTPKVQLTDEQRAQLKALVKAQIRDMFSRRDELMEQANVQRQVWQALIDCPTWSIVQSDKPADTPADEIWSMTPIVNKR